MAQELVNKLFDHYVGRPILVIGGGPSATKDLGTLKAIGFTPACVISANDHAAHQPFYAPTLGINMDQRDCFTKEPMQPRMRAMNVPLVSKHSWADFHLGNWTFHGNTGLNAIVLAAALGGHPVVPVGIDLFTGGRQYFHKTVKPEKREHSLGRIARRELKTLANMVTGANIRPLSGPLLEFFPPYDQTEKLAPYVPTWYRAQMARQKTVYLTVGREFSVSTYDRAKCGTVLARTATEAAQIQAKGFC